MRSVINESPLPLTLKPQAGGLTPAHDTEDWLAAEIEVNDQLNRQFINL
jgi:hypothetical protein